MSYKNKKYALILGRSVEGCGCSFCAHQLQTWCDKNGVDLQIYGYAGKKMSRTNSHNIRYTPYKIEHFILFKYYISLNLNIENIIHNYNKEKNINEVEN